MFFIKQIIRVDQKGCGVDIILHWYKLENIGENGNINPFVICHRQSTNEMKMSVAKDMFYFTLWLCNYRGMRCETFSSFYSILCALDLQKWLFRSPYRWVRNPLSRTCHTRFQNRGSIWNIYNNFILAGYRLGLSQ